jgi:chemotaxis protein methyltransferase CheR
MVREEVIAGAPEPLAPAEFSRLRELAYRHFGLDLKPGKEALVEARLGKALRRDGFRTFRQYCDHLESSGAATGAITELGDALSTNFTSFMREPAHFEYLKRTVVPEFAARSGGRIWSAACSTGEEPYSVLFTLLEALPSANIRILASDISTRVLAAAQRAIYSIQSVEAMPEAWRRRYFLRGNGKSQGWMRVKPEFRSMVEFSRINLVSGDLPSGEFPVILCRNVMIYFDKPTQENVVRRLSSRLGPGGHLLIGHSESLTGVRHGLDYVQPATYRRSAR